jgi:hypothetical protein
MERSALPTYVQSSQQHSGRMVGILRDMFRAALLGDFALDLGPAGAITQVLLACTPVVGALCAVRDMAADFSHRDRLGFLLNGLVLIPVLGGIAKTLDVIHNSQRVEHARVSPPKPRQCHPSDWLL